MIRRYQPVIRGGNLRGPYPGMKPVFNGQWMKVKEHNEIVGQLQERLHNAVTLGTAAVKKLASLGYPKAGA